MSNPDFPLREIRADRNQTKEFEEFGKSGLRNDPFSLGFSSIAEGKRLFYRLFALCLLFDNFAH
jgi:hypothetical protein